MSSNVPEPWNTALDEVAAELLHAAGITAPPVDALQLAERLEIPVALDGTLRTRGRHKRLAGRSSIFLRPEERPERLQWAAAHELGEVVGWRVFERAASPDDPPDRLREQIANALASRLLLPTDWFCEDARACEGDVLQLKRIYGTASHELVAYRLLDLPRPAVITIFDHGRLSRRRSNGPGRSPGLQPVERTCQARINSSGRRCTVHEEPLTVRGWPVHEPGWQREILHTTLLGDEGVVE